MDVRAAMHLKASSTAKPHMLAKTHHKPYLPLVVCFFLTIGSDFAIECEIQVQNACMALHSDSSHAQSLVFNLIDPRSTFLDTHDSTPQFKMPASILDLPDEVLGPILDAAHIHLSTLFYIALSSKRLFAICLEKCLTKRGLIKPEEKCKISLPTGRNEPWDVVSVLTLSPSFTKTRYLEIRIPWGHKSYEASQIQYRRVTQMISKLSSVEEAVLRFENGAERCSRWEGANTISFCEALGGILNALLAHGCTSLQIWGLDQQDQIFVNKVGSAQRRHSSDRTTEPIEVTSKNVSQNLFPPHSQPTGMNTCHPEPTVLSGPTWLSHSPHWSTEPLIQISPEARADTRLASLTICSGWQGAMLQPPMLQWMYDVLSLPTLTTLVLQDLDGLFPELWTILADILPHAQSTIRHLTIKNMGEMSPRDLFMIVDGFPFLETLSVDGTTLPDDLPHLEGHDKYGTFQYNPSPGSEVDLGFAYPRWTHLRELRILKEWLVDGPQLTRVLSESAMALEQFTVVLVDWEWSMLMGFKRALAWDSVSIVGMKALFTNFAEGDQPLRFQVNVEIRLPRTNTVQWMRPTGVLTGTELSNVQAWSRAITGVVFVARCSFLIPGERIIPPVWTPVGRWFTDILPSLQRVEFKAESAKDQATTVALQKFLRNRVIREALRGIGNVQLNGKEWRW